MSESSELDVIVSIINFRVSLDDLGFKAPMNSVYEVFLIIGDYNL